jgi:general secretion pathway protein G
MASSKRQTGSTLLELVVMGVIISILAMLLLNRLLRYQEAAEKTVMETTVINMRTGLRLRIAELMVQNRMDEMARVSRENPISWLAAPPRSYAGQLDHPEWQDIRPGSWYFDNGTQELVYLPSRSKYLKPGPDGLRIIRFHVTAVTRQGEKGAAPVVEGVAITPVVPYDWPVF